MQRSAYYALPAILALALMAGQAIESLARPTPKDAEPYHKFVRGVAERLPKQFGDWRGEDQEPMRGAVKLLRPNVMIQRRFVNSATGEYASLLIVHCKDARDLNGHWPPVCYPAQGFTMDRQIDRDWALAGRKIPGREYTFSRTDGLRTSSLHVYGLLLLPASGAVRDMRDIGGAAADFLRQFYGASQIQLVMDDSLPADRRDRIFLEIMEANMPIIDALTAGGSR
ncbi:MAG: exosortase-associated EpsI family protein [Tepidisphaeraceae bacterium]|jgi:hypothetical protein